MVDFDSISNRIKTLIAYNKTKEALLELNKIPKIDNEIENEIKLYLSRFHESESRFNQGRMTYTDYNVSKTSLNYAILIFIDKLVTRISITSNQKLNEKSEYKDYLGRHDIEEEEKNEEKTKIWMAIRLFDRAAFDASFRMEEPTAMFSALQETRISIQTIGVLSLRYHDYISHKFRRIRSELMRVESEIFEKMPIIANLAMEFENSSLKTNERSEKVRKILRDFDSNNNKSDSFNDSVHLMMSIRYEINKELNDIKSDIR